MLGIHIVAANAGEMIAEGVLAMECAIVSRAIVSMATVTEVADYAAFTTPRHLLAHSCTHLLAHARTHSLAQVRRQRRGHRAHLPRAPHDERGLQGGRHGHLRQAHPLLSLRTAYVRRASGDQERVCATPHPQRCGETRSGEWRNQPQGGRTRGCGPGLSCVRLLMTSRCPLLQ